MRTQSRTRSRTGTQTRTQRINCSYKGCTIMLSSIYFCPMSFYDLKKQIMSYFGKINLYRYKIKPWRNDREYNQEWQKVQCSYMSSSRP
jgi:hypothetical protein